MGSTEETGKSTPPASDVVLKVGIIGAGIGGLAAAIALTDSGHDVEIYERSRFASEIGAGIHMTPNSCRILQHYGFDLVAAHGSEASELAWLSPETGEVLNVMQYPDCRQRYGAPWFLFHRADLHNALMHDALEPPTKRKAARLHLQMTVTDVDTDGTIYLANGDQVKKDLVIIANGIHTELIQKVTVSPVKNEAAGKAMIRFLIPMDEVARDPRTKAIHDAGLGRFLYCIKDGRTFVSYPCRAGATANCAIFYNDTHDWQGTWSLPATKDDALKAVEGYADMFQALCDKAVDLSTWRLATREEPVQKLTNGRLVLAGDALHPMLPFLGQGAAMAVEDAAALGVFMSSLSSIDDVSQRLQLYQDLRANRVCAMQILSSWATEGYPKVIEKSKPFFEPGKQPEDRETINDWCFEQDVRAQALEMLDRHLRKA